MLFRSLCSHPLWRHFPEASPHTQGTMSRSYNPSDASPQRRFGLFPVRSPLLGESRLISLPLGTEMFQFPRLPPPRLCVRRGVPGLWSRRVRPFGDPRVWRACAPNRGLSQLVTSFVGFLCQGIHRVRLPSSLRWPRTYTYVAPGAFAPGAIRCDLLEKRKLFVFVTLCGSQGTARASPRDRTLRAGRGERRPSAGPGGLARAPSPSREMPKETKIFFSAMVAPFRIGVAR